ncbi:uncharacterized protein PFL1_04759 [Pseudozyma flocculosa PF-1]|uniref:L-2-hydroxyglutarate dehydrogenase, mitochondrial n=2 Tax=Pseudozyma flocculosa TaxID=84751 RepID=A0A5C3F722_9BASI|nr:uncharacterized protein PFL1_04759 [Pseudozyma flocculosa PF-1]EPQ27621.1 hypothetical protein PFL1_04759 [Pseudozyma flocculosa PF-1]SPO39249.1 uncharacterized protein PSFLO_04729 [Pseudozyma flocculosa]
MPPRPRLASALPGPSTLRQHGAIKSSSPPSPRPRAYATDASTAIRPLVATLPSRSRYAYKEPELTVDHLVVGGGVVGLSIAAALAKRWPNKSTYLVERHRHFGEETSSRNSEVIHAGLYYPSHSLKTRLCLEGRELIYQRCQRLGIPYKQTKKLVVGGDYAQPYLAKLKQHCDSLGPLSPPTRLLSGDEARQLEPDLADSIGCALLSERTGIVSSHELMASLERELLDAENAEIVYDTRVVRVDPSRASSSPSSSSSSLGAKRGTDGSRQGWVVQTVTSDAGTSSDSDALLAKVVVNSSGLNGPMVLNSLLGSMGSQEPLIPMWYAKGNYASYKGPGTRNVEHLIYPVPDTRKGTHAHTSLGTHLTLDLDGNVRFGPDTEWLSPPAPSSSSYSSSSSLDAVDEDHIDFWRKSLTVSESRLPTMYSQITEYLPHISRDGLAPDYAGIRPKLIGPGQGGFMDFTFLWHRSGDLGSQHLWQHAPGTGPASPTTTTATTPPPVGRHHVQAPSEGSGGAMISLLGIESPGLTSSLAIGEYVRDMVARSYYGDHRKEEVRNKGARNEDVGGSGVDAWA